MPPVRGAYEDVGYKDLVFDVYTPGCTALKVTLPVAVYLDNGVPMTAYPSRVIWLEENQLVPVRSVYYNETAKTVSFVVKLNFTEPTLATYRVYYSQLLITEDTTDTSYWVNYTLSITNDGSTTGDDAIRITMVPIYDWYTNNFIGQNYSGMKVVDSAGNLAQYWIPSAALFYNQSTDATLFIKDTFPTGTTNYTVLLCGPSGSLDYRNTTGMFTFFDDFDTFSGWTGSTSKFTVENGYLRCTTGGAAAAIYKSPGLDTIYSAGDWVTFGAAFVAISGASYIDIGVDSNTVHFSGTEYYMRISIPGTMVARRYVTTSDQALGGAVSYTVFARNAMRKTGTSTAYLAGISATGDPATTYSQSYGYYVTNFFIYFPDNSETDAQIYIDAVFGYKYYPSLSSTITLNSPTYTLTTGPLVSVQGYSFTGVTVTVPEWQVPDYTPLNPGWGEIPLDNYTGPSGQHMLAMFWNDNGRYALILLPVLMMLLGGRHYAGIMGIAAAMLCIGINLSLGFEAYSTTALGLIGFIALLILMTDKG